SGPVSVTVICYGLGTGSIVTIVGSNDGDPGPAKTEVGNVANRIYVDETAHPVPGSPPVPTTPPGGTTTTPSGGPPATGSGWTGDAKPYRGSNGKRVTWSCAPGGSVSSIWGTSLYT